MQISINELLNIDEANIIDIRTREKYNDNHIPGAINIPYNELINNPSKYINRNNIYYIYCQRGISSLKCTEMLLFQGYKVVNIIGGYESYILK